MISGVKAYSKLKWTPEEEQLLRVLKQENHIDSWKIIANEMNKIFLEKNRSGKQCRERYMNYVRFSNEVPKTLGWTQQEDEELFVKFMQHGAKWVQIGKQMPGRSENCLKNRFYGAMRKIIRKINRASKQKKLRQKKPIKTDLLIRILEHEPISKETVQENHSDMSQFLEGLKKEMIKIAINPEQNSATQQIQSLINGIIRYCNIIKSPGNKKKCFRKQHESQQQSIQSIVESVVENQQNQNNKKQEQNGFEEDAGTLVSNKSIETKHKRITNFILVSSIELNLQNRVTQVSQGQQNETNKQLIQQYFENFRKDSNS